MKDEYNEIYGQYEGSGFAFAYAGGKIGRSLSLPKSEVDKIDAGKRNKDDVPLFVRGVYGLYARPGKSDGRNLGLRYTQSDGERSRPVPKVK